jgi:dimethylhistidine N-methyltransferase
VDDSDPQASYSHHETFALDVLTGLSEPRKSIPTIYHYDTEGSRLFDRITQLDEYYPTRCEFETLQRNKSKFGSCARQQPFNLIEFGPGDGSKAKLLVQELLEQGCKFRYVPIDISRSALENLVEDFGRHYPSLPITGLACDYFAGIKWLTNCSERNFHRDDARLFLRNLWNCLNDGDHALIGFDLKKDIDLLIKAYNDSRGVTAEFNLNMLRRINRELGGNFDVSKFRHFCTYDLFTGAMESYLVSLVTQEVFIEAIGRSFHFKPWEPIHTEYSYKYHESDIDSLAQATGFVVKEHMYDAERYFADSLWQVKKTEGPN